jgi:uncharacterized protein (TIGR00725 family)
MAKTVIGVMGGGEHAPEYAVIDAYRLGELIAERGWVLLNGGRNAGVMEASARGAQTAGGLVVGVLPDADTRRASPHLDVRIVTGMGSARNNVNVLSSDVVIACAGGEGTISEIALALTNGKTVVALNFDTGMLFERARNAGQLVEVASPDEAVEAAARFVGE